MLAVLVVGSGVTFALSRGGDDKVPTASESATTVPSESTSESPSPAPDQADPVITASKLYAVGRLPATNCPEVKVLPTTFTTARAYYTAMIPCMNRTWHAALQKAKLPFRGPKLAVYTGRINSACGIQNGTRSAYCDRSQTIYLPYAPGAGVYRRNPLAGRVWMMNTMAHEYGRHVQNLAGISGASLARQEGWPEDQKLAESRRRDLQAACFGSTYLGSAKASIPIAGQVSAAWQALVANTGDENARPRIRARGSKASHKYWSTKGFSNPNPGGCNTFTAPDAQTS